MNESEERLARAARRGGYHLLRALSEVLEAVSAMLEELGAKDKDDERQDAGSPQRIQVD